MVNKFCWDLESSGLLDNLFERIICICVQNLDTKEIHTFCGKDEKKILEDFYKLVDSSCLYGYNNQSFDDVFVTRRAVVLGVKVTNYTSIDLRKIVNGFKYSYNRYEKGSLRDWAVALGEKVETHNGSEMFKLWKEGETEKIKAHCLEDIKITRKLYERCKECGLI